MERRRTLFILAAAVATAVVAAPPASARDLYWRSLQVEARLADDGSLWVTEWQTMVFDGDWNGGERVFRLGPGQKVELRGITRVDRDGGGRVDLLHGNLNQVDHWSWTDGTTVRWRSRLPTDPPFSSQEITYVLDYRLTGILRPTGGDVYRLDHDFAFPDRAGRIERYRLDLTVDPAFEAQGELPRRVERENLPPGQSVVLTARLRYRGEGRPAATPPPPAPFAARMAAILAMAAVMAWLFVRFRRRETALGRAAGRLPQPPDLDRAWIEERLLAFLPEEVGALWDRKVGAPEVAALLARLVAEGKLEGGPVEGGKKKASKNLRLRLLVGRNAFEGYERELIDKLFYAGREEVTTSQLKNKYRSTGFDPAAVVKPGIEERLAERTETSPAGRPKPSRWPTLGLFLAVAVLVVAELVANRTTGYATIAATVSVLPWMYVPAAIVAYLSRKQVEYLGRWMLALGVPTVALAAGGARVLLAPELAGLARFVGGFVPGFGVPGLFGTLALALLPIAVLRSVTNLASSRETPEAIALRQQLLQARRHLEGELERERPDLEDAWFPYLLALGLSSAVDRWSVKFAGAATGAAVAAGAAASSLGSFSGGGSSGGGWTGGGGSFGGAGASASWAAAVTGMAAGVAAPSSSGSSGGGGGGGGGGSSGGGGGGGW